MEDKVCSKICTMLWLWWFERNKAHSGERIRGCNEIQASIEIHCKEFEEEWNKKEKTPKLPCSDKWKPPPPNVLLKILTKVDGDMCLEMIKERCWQQVQDLCNIFLKLFMQKV